MTQETYQYILKILMEHEIALISTIEYMEFLLNQRPKFRIELIEDEDAYAEQIRDLKVEKVKLGQAYMQLRETI
jgi:hypothetical protein